MSRNPFIKTPFPEFKDPEQLSEKQAGKEIGQLREAIEKHNQFYYVENDPQISDKQYDRLFERLLELEEAFPGHRSRVSPTKKIGAPPAGALKKKKHAAPMLSLDSSEKKEKAEHFLKQLRKKTGKDNPEFIMEPKFDGLSVEVVYEHGEFSHGVTRGDGETGEDISANVKTIGSLPLRLSNENGLPDFLPVRGEIFMGKDDFHDLNKKRIEKGEKPFANARNAAAGIVRQLDPAKVADKPLDIFFYEIIEPAEHVFESHWELLKRFKKWGLKTNPEVRKGNSFEQISDYHRSMEKKREELPYEIDGIVIKLNDRPLRKKLGVRQRSPRWAFAWKFSPRQEVSTLKEIVVQVGRSGILTPVALLEPVDVGGVTVSRATLHNEDEVNRKDVRPGDRVKIFRAGDVIPGISGRVEKTGKKREKTYKMPLKCPACHTEVVREGAYVVCPAGLSCPAQLKGSLKHFASRPAMNIEELGAKTIGQLVDREMVKRLPDLYTLKTEDLSQLPGFAEKSSKKLHDSIRNSRDTTLSSFIYALGIRHVGTRTARILAREYESLDRLMEASAEDLASISDIGKETAESIAHFFSNADNRKMIEKLKEAGLKIGLDMRGTSSRLEGKTFVITGELEDFRREEAKEKIEALGGRATSGISDNTDYLVVGENPGSKLDEAKKRNIPTLDEKEFKKMIET